MRIPHYLHKAPSGVFHFRRRMPSCLHVLVGRPVIKKSLLTRDIGVARDLALKLWRAYDELHQHVRNLAMAGMTKDVKSLIERLKKSGTQYRLIHKPDGTVEIEVTGPEEHALAMEFSLAVTSTLR
jgi:ribosomal protein L1